MRVWWRLLRTLAVLTGGGTVVLLAHTERYTTDREAAFFRRLRAEFPAGAGQLPATAVRELCTAAGSILADDGRTTLWALRRG